MTAPSVSALGVCVSGAVMTVLALAGGMSTVNIWVSGLAVGAGLIMVFVDVIGGVR